MVVRGVGGMPANTVHSGVQGAQTSATATTIPCRPEVLQGALKKTNTDEEIERMQNPVSLESVMSNKKKTTEATMSHFSQIGITFIDKLEFEAHNALLRHVSRSFSQASQESADNMEMKWNPVCWG